jgi:hypothetical protein
MSLIIYHSHSESRNIKLILLTYIKFLKLMVKDRNVFLTGPVGETPTSIFAFFIKREESLYRGCTKKKTKSKQQGKGTRQLGPK